MLLIGYTEGIVQTKHMEFSMRLLKKISIIIGCALSITCSADEGKLVVGVEASRAPFVYVDKSQKLEGFEIDLLRAIAKENGLSVEFSDMPFDALLPSVLTEQVDVAISCISMTEERAQIVDFVGPYYNAGLNVLIPNEYQDKIKNSFDLNGRKICVVSGTTCEDYANTRNGSEILKFSSEKESFDAVENKECDLLISDAPFIDYELLKQHPGKYYKFENNLTSEEFGIMTSKLRPELRDKIESGLKKIEKNGEYDKLYKKWFG
jgi:ABC-type amino acid transport substrate-binding protein